MRGALQRFALALIVLVGAQRVARAEPRIPEVTCSGVPATGPSHWRHRWKSRIATAFGKPNHRGIDLVAGAGSATQTIRGELRYGLVDKSLEDESVELFACQSDGWHALGSARSDGDGHFALELTGTARLPVGIRTLYASVVGDRSGVAFVAMVAPDHTPLVVTDVDGTLTESESAFPMSLLRGGVVGAQDGAAPALEVLRIKGYLPIYVSSRGRFLTERTRAWLASHGFPRGALRLASAPVTLPGPPTTAYKTGAIAALAAAGLTPFIGLGNRASDVESYQAAGIAPARIFIKLPEFAGETQAMLARGAAVGFASYALDLAPVLQRLPPAGP